MHSHRFCLADMAETSRSSSSSDTTLWPEQITLSEKRTYSRRFKCLFFIAFFFFLVAVTFIAAFLIIFLNDKDSSVDDNEKTSAEAAQSDVCLTDGCLRASKLISDSVDTSANPCEDFYQFACGQWRNTHTIAADEPSVTPRAISDKRTINMLKEELAKRDSAAPEAITKTRKFFRSCENTDLMDRRGPEPLKHLLLSGGDHLFPTLSPSWKEEGLSFSEMTRRIGSIGGLQSVPFIGVNVVVDIKQSERAIIEFDQRLTLLAPSLYMRERNSSVLTRYEALYTDILTLLGANETIAKQDAKDIVDFEMKLAKILDPPQLRMDEVKMYNKMTIRNLTDRYPEFDWLGHLQRLFNEVNITITEDEFVVNMALGYYDKLFPLISSTPERTLLNYGMWRITRTLSGLVNKELRDAKDGFNQFLHGVPRSSERWLQCVEVTMAYFPHVIGRLYVEHANFTQRAKRQLEQMTNSLLTAFKDMVSESDWMTESTKQAALQKADKMGYKIGFSDSILNDTWLNQRFKSYKIAAATFFENNINIFLQNRLREMSTLRQPVNNRRWAFSAASSNAGYIPTRNEIEFAAGILQSPYFNDQFPDAMNYGAIGSLIGHEIIHGYDITGRLYDKYGNLDSWWKKEDEDNFLSRARCMMDQYANFTDLDNIKAKVNGIRTLSENIADNGGLKQSYRAYRRLIEERGVEEPRIPNCQYTSDQLFFIAFAQMWCGKFRDSYREYLLKVDTHSPHRVRVLGTLQNNRDFAKAFDCKAGSPMNPLDKCHVW